MLAPEQREQRNLGSPAPRTAASPAALHVSLCPAQTLEAVRIGTRGWHCCTRWDSRWPVRRVRGHHPSSAEDGTVSRLDGRCNSFSLGQVELEGLTGHIEFNSKGQRSNYALKILQHTRSGFRQVRVEEKGSPRKRGFICRLSPADSSAPALFSETAASLRHCQRTKASYAAPTVRFGIGKSLLAWQQ